MNAAELHLIKICILLFQMLLSRHLPKLKYSRAFTTNSATLTFEDEFHKNHIPTNTFQKLALSVGSAAVSILDPHRGDMIACLGETTGNTVY